MPVRTVVERGPKGKKAVAFAVDWPGWSRGAKTPELALEMLESYRERYRPIAVAAGMADEFDAAGPLDVVEDRVGTASTDFWGISFSPSGFEHEPMDDTEIDREGKRMRSWNLPFLIRHSAYHAMDYAWEMEDKDLSAPTD